MRKPAKPTASVPRQLSTERLAAVTGGKVFETSQDWNVHIPQQRTPKCGTGMS